MSRSWSAPAFQDCEWGGACSIARRLIYLIVVVLELVFDQIEYSYTLKSERIEIQIV